MRCMGRVEGTENWLEEFERRREWFCYWGTVLRTWMIAWLINGEKESDVDEKSPP